MIDAKTAIKQANSEARRARNAALRSRKAITKPSKPTTGGKRKLLPARVHYLYLFGCPQLNYYKIGISTMPERRLSDLNVPFEMEILATYLIPEGMNALQIETNIHAEFADRRIRGEWFSNIAREEFETEFSKITTESNLTVLTTLESK